MSTEAGPPTFRGDPAVRLYTLVCLASLLFILVVEMEQGLEPLALLPVLAGLIGLALRSNLTSLMVLVALGGRFLMYYQMGLGRHFAGWSRLRPEVRFPDVLLCGAVLAFVMAHYRLLGLVKNVFPPDPRLTAADQEGRLRRSARLAGPLEWLGLLLALPVWALLAQLAWQLLPGRGEPPLGMPAPLWRLAATAWLFALVLVVAAGLLGYWRRRGMTAREGRMFLQDTLWNDTRREQRWVGRWLAWYRLRRRREEEAS